MGQAKQRGTFEQRQTQGIAKNEKKARDERASDKARSFRFSTLLAALYALETRS